VADTTPPEVLATASPAVLWPPDHRLVPVRLLLQSHDACSTTVAVRLNEARSGEPDDAPGGGDGRTTGDIAGAALGSDDRELLLRAERAVPGPGRTYTLVYGVADPSGNVRQVSVSIVVPPEQGRK